MGAELTDHDKIPRRALMPTHPNLIDEFNRSQAILKHRDNIAERHKSQLQKQMKINPAMDHTGSNLGPKKSRQR